MKHISVHCRAEAETLTFEVPHIYVSISLPGDPSGTAKLSTNKHTLGVLQLTFWDLDRLVPVDPDLVDEVRAASGITYEMEKQLFEPRHARAILAFVNAYPEAEHVVFHCDAGLSRSPGAAAAIAKIFNGDDTDIFNRHSGLNRRVYRMILEAHQEVAETEDDPWKP
jgi:hypothetical protein